MVNWSDEIALTPPVAWNLWLILVSSLVTYLWQLISEGFPQLRGLGTSCSRAYLKLFLKNLNTIK